MLYTKGLAYMDYLTGSGLLRTGQLDGSYTGAPDLFLANIWGRLAADTQQRGIPISENDTWIAACCLSEGLPLVTRNVKDFMDFADHHGLVLITE